MDNAVTNARANVVQWLHRHHQEGYHSGDGYLGYLETVKWLRTNHSEGALLQLWSVLPQVDVFE